MRLFGILLIIIALLVPIYWFLELTPKFPDSALFSLYLGSAALIAMGISQLLATRFWGVELIFGSLDRIYILHKWLGFGALVTMLLHDMIDADIDNLGPETILTEIADTFGEFSLYAFMILIIITVATIIPYRLWYWTHRFMGALFVMAAIHYFYILKPFDNFSTLGIYVGSFCILGIVAYFYTLIPFSWMPGRHKYKISAIEKTGNSLAVSLTPVKRGLRHQAGQFSFLKFSGAKLGEEVHPFTISSAPKSDRSLRFTIKEAGDYTRKLDGALSMGAHVDVSNSHGHFKLHKKSPPNIWIAGGIGITPFMAWAHSLTPANGNVDLFYCVRQSSEAAHLDELQQLANEKPNLTLHLIESSRGPRLDAARIANSIDLPLSSMHVHYCGPEGMRDSLRAGLRKAGLKSSRFHFEQFEIRTGIGLLKIGRFLWRIFGLGRQKLTREQTAE